MKNNTKKKLSTYQRLAHIGGIIFFAVLVCYGLFHAYNFVSGAIYDAYRGAFMDKIESLYPAIKECPPEEWHPATEIEWSSADKFQNGDGTFYTCNQHWIAGYQAAAEAIINKL